MTDYSKYFKHKLSNGIKLISEHLPFSKSVTISFWVKAGSRHEAEDEMGISHFLEHMVFKGTEKRKIYHIANGIESVGGYINAMTDKENTCYYARLPFEYSERGIEILSDLVFNSSFRVSEIEKEKQVVIDELKGVEDNAEDWIGDLFEEQLFYNHPLGFPVIGKEETVNSFSLKHLQKRGSIHQDPSNILIAVTGNFDQEKLISQFEKHLKVKLKKNPILTKKFNAKNKSPKNLELIKPINQSHLMLGTFTPKMSDSKINAGMMINSILGSGMSSRLNLRIREKYGFCYSIYSFLSGYSDTGAFGIAAAIDNKKIEKLETLIMKELNDFQKNGPTKREYDSIKKAMKGGLMIASESMSNRNLSLAKSELIYGKNKTLNDLIKEIESVTLEDIHNYLLEFPINHIQARVLIRGTES